MDKKNIMLENALLEKRKKNDNQNKNEKQKKLQKKN